MKIRWQRNVFVRHADDESIVWCPRTGGCTMMGYVQPFLEEMKAEWRDELNIDSVVAGKVDCSLNEVAADARMVFEELILQGFVETTGSLIFVQAMFEQAISRQSHSRENVTEAKAEDCSLVGD